MKAAAARVLILSISLVGCGSESNQFNPPPSQPNISISPVSATAGSSDLVLTVTGSNFGDDAHKKSIVVWFANNHETTLATTFESTTQLRAVVPAALLATPITAKVFVKTGDPIGSIPFSKSDSITFMVVSVPPKSVSVSAISPMSVVAGSPDLTLTIMGSNFATGNASGFHSAVLWNNTSLATTVISDTQLTAVVPAALLANPVKATIQVQIFFFADSFPTAVSNSVTFTVTAP